MEESGLLRLRAAKPPWLCSPLKNRLKIAAPNKHTWQQHTDAPVAQGAAPLQTAAHWAAGKPLPGCHWDREQLILGLHSNAPWDT